MKKRFCIFAIILILINVIVFPLSVYAENSEAIKNSQTDSSTAICSETIDENETSSEKEDGLSSGWIALLVIGCIILLIIAIKLDALEVLSDLVEIIVDLFCD